MTYELFAGVVNVICCIAGVVAVVLSLILGAEGGRPYRCAAYFVLIVTSLVYGIPRLSSMALPAIFAEPIKVRFFLGWCYIVWGVTLSAVVVAVFRALGMESRLTD